MARSSYWQRIYKSSKECNGVRLFENEFNFTGLQTLFLYWLDVYSMLYSENSSKEWDILDEEVIKDDLRTDAFLYWRQKEIEKVCYENKKEIKKTKNQKRNKKGMKSYNIYKGE